MIITNQDNITKYVFLNLNFTLSNLEIDAHLLPALPLGKMFNYRQHLSFSIRHKEIFFNTSLYLVYSCEKMK